jgi:hypothetical protein
MQINYNLCSMQRSFACITLSNADILPELLGFLDFFHHPDFQELENTTFRKLDLFPSSGVGEGKHLSWVP